MIGNKIFDTINMLNGKRQQMDDEDIDDDLDALEEALEPV